MKKDINKNQPGQVPRYFLSSDNSGHNYIVPSKFKKEWNEWLELDEDDEMAWDAPEFAERIEGEFLEFEYPTANGVPIFSL